MTAKTWQLSHLKYMAEERKKEVAGKIKCLILINQIKSNKQANTCNEKQKNVLCFTFF
jgi:hypothetical protein